MEFYSNGKLLITGEYVILNGALSLALPTIYGQYLKVKNNSANKIKWISYDNNEKIWFNCEFDKDNLEVIFSSSDKLFEDGILLMCCLKLLITYSNKLLPFILGETKFGLFIACQFPSIIEPLK